MELDVYIPTYTIAFEYQGSQHYTEHFRFGPLIPQRKRDEEKKELCQRVSTVY
jgi:hypothetical protein